MSKGKEAGKIQVYVRVRPFTEKEKEKREANAIEIHQEHSLIRVLDPRSRTNYFFDGVFSPEATNQELYFKVGKPLVYAALNGYKGTLLTYGQTGTGKTFTLLSDDGITTRVVQHCFEKIASDEIHNYKVMCSFLQVYQEKVYDLLNPRFIVDLPVREHPKKGVYVANLTQHEVKSAGDVFALLEIGKQHLVIAETKMVRHSSRSHSIMQLIVERRLKAHIANEKPPSQRETQVSHEAVQESIMAVDETINNLIKELKQERKSHHKHERECLKELMEKELNNGNNFEGDLIVKGKINLCDLAGSERLTKTKAEGVRLTEAKYLNTSLLELGNVIYALARGHKRHVPYRNSTLTRLLQDCLGDNGKTNFIICIAPSLSEVNETKCSLNFGLRAMRITNVARLNVEVDYKVLAERLAKKLEDHDIKYKFEKLEYLREIQRLKSAISCYQESENFAGKDHEKLVSVIANLSKSVQREKEEKNNLQTELVCLKRQVSQPAGNNTPDVEAVLLAELMSMELLANLQTPDVTKSILSDSSLSAKVKSHLALVDTQEALLNNASCFLQLLDLHLDSEQSTEKRKVASEASDCVQLNFSKAGSVELFSKDCSIKISPRGASPEPCFSLPMYNTSSDESAGLAGGVRRMLGRLIGRDKDRTPGSPEMHPSIRACPSLQASTPGKEEKSHDQEEAMRKTKVLLKQLSNSREKVEQQVLSLMSSLFEEQIDKKEGQSLQWNELGKKLKRLIIFRSNNMPGLSDADVWANSEDLNSILENCLRFVIIDKALLACLLVIELLDLRKARAKLEDKKLLVNSIAQENVTSPEKTQDQRLGVKGNFTATEDKNKVRETEMISPRGSASPRREKLSSLKHTKTELEMEISEMHEDTTKLETELFSTMEEKTKVEEELFGVKHYVTKLRSELFHLKLEKSNLEKDVKRSKSQENIQQLTDSDDAKLHVDSPKDGQRGYPELSDVMEASHESNDSENSSQMSDGNESREAFLKTCMESISKIYTFMPNPEEIVRSEDELSDDQEPTLSDANIDDSDEEIIITKLARSLRSPSTSPAKEKSFVAPSPNKSGKTEVLSNSKSLLGVEDGDELSSNSKEALIKQIQELKRKLRKAEQDFVDAQETSEELEEELDHKKGQLAEAQQTITNLENQVEEEKETSEQIRQQYFNVKNQNDVLDEKIKALRSELERVLVRESNTVTGALQSTEGVRGNNPPSSPRKSSKSFIKAPGKTKASKIDLRNAPSRQLTSNEMEVVGLIEENAELKVKLEKATQEKARLEKSQKLLDDKCSKTKASLQVSEDACNRLKSELSTLAKEKAKLTGEVTDLRYNNAGLTEELQRHRERSARLEKDLEAIAYMSTRLEKDNKTLQDEISIMELELTSWKSKHQESSTEIESAKKERDQIEKECEKVHHELESLRKERKELLDQRFSNEKESKRRDDEMKSKKERFYELESELSEQKRLNSNLQKELAGMSEYQETLEKEYSRAKSEEERLQQELIKLRSRSADSKTEFSLFTQNADDEDTSSGRNLLKTDLSRPEKTLKVKSSKKFYTITHTSEDEIGDTSSSIAESPADDNKHLEHENQLLKLENGYLHQQLAESEQVLTMYRQDLESAHDLIDKLQANVKVEDDNKTMVVEEDCRTPSDKDDTIKELEDCSENSADEYKILEEKHAELTREYEILRMHYQNVLTDKNKDTTGSSKDKTNLNQAPFDENKTKELSNFKKEISRLQERIQQLEGENYQLKISGQEDLEHENSRKNLLKKLEDEKRVKLTLKEEINALESENEAMRMKLEVSAMQKGRKSRRLSLDDQLTCLMSEKEVVKTHTSQSINGATSQNSPKASNQQELDANVEGKTRKLEEDLLKVSSEKLKLEFQLRSSQTDCERLRNDLHQSESERDLLNTQLDENIEKAANLEIRLMEMRCSCETIKNEINTLKNEKRQESFHLHEASVCKEILEKRLENALRENNVLHHELDILREEQKESQNKSAKLEKDKYQLTKEIEDVKAQILRLEEDFEGDKARLAESTNAGNEIEQEESLPLQKPLENKAKNDKGQELRKEIEKVTADFNQAKSELEEVRSAKKSFEKHLENMKETQSATVENVEPRHEEPNSENENTPDSGGTTFDTIEIEKHTKLLETEKGLLEKELTRVQEECNNLKEKLEIIKLASENAQTQEERRIELEQKQKQLEKELQELRELNQKLENESDDSHKLIHQLEVKTKALESLQKELRCFHEENDRLTHEVDIIHHTSKAMTDHQNCKDSLEKENSSLKQELEFLKHSNRKLQLQTEDLNKEIETLQEKLRGASSTGKVNVSLQSELEKFQKMQQHLEGELSSCKEKTKELESTNDSLKKENKAVKGRIKSLEQRNQEMKRKEEKKKESNTESKSKPKFKTYQGLTRESKEVQTETHRITEEADDSLQEKIKQLEIEKFQLEKQLNISAKTESECSSLQEALRINMSKQCSPEDETLNELGKKSSTTLLGNKDEEETREQKYGGEIAALTGDIRAGFTKMAKENLLLEKKASHFARSQIRLEQSFAKAMRENSFLSSKLVEAENIIIILREKEQELENKSTFSPVATNLKETLMTSHNKSGSNQDDTPIEETKENRIDNEKESLTKDAEEMKVLTSDGNRGQQSKSRKSIGANDQTEKEPKLEESNVIHREDSLVSNANTPSKEGSCLVNQTQALAEVEGPKSHKVILQSESVPKSETMENESYLETVKADHQLPKCKDHYSLSKSPSDTDQLWIEKEQLLEQLEGLESEKNEMEREETRHLKASNNPEYPTQSDVDQLLIETCKSVHDESEKEYPESGLKGTKEDVEIEKETESRRCEEENALLKEERKTLLDELEASKNERNLIGIELRYSKESCLKQKQEIKLLLSSYTQEKESLLKELEDTKSDCRQAKDKVRELQQIETDFDNIQKKTKEAEKIIIELEKDLLSQTEMKNGLERELQTCRNKLEESEHLETQLRASRAENEDLINTNVQLVWEVKKWKDENEIKMERTKWSKMEKKKTGNLNADNPSLQDQSVQTESAPRDNVERPKDPTGADLPVQDSCNDAAHHLVHSNKPCKTNEHQQDPSGREFAQTGELTANTSITKTRTFNGVPIPVITVSCVDEIEKMTKKDRTAMLSLSDLEDFENESPNDQSTPDEDITIKPEKNGANIKGRTKEPWCNVSKSSEGKGKMLECMDQRNAGENNEGEPQANHSGSTIQNSQEFRDANSVLQNEKDTCITSRERHNNEVLEDQVMEMNVNQQHDMEIIFGHSKADASKCEMEWTISTLRSELQQRSEDIERSQHEISLLEEEQVSMKREISSLLSECESLKAKTAVLQTQNEAILKEQILNDEENEELQQNLQELTQERNSIEESRRNLESQKARLEIELSDAIEARDAIEKELLRIRSEDNDLSRQRLEEQLHNISERYAKLETVLSCVLDENSKMTAEVSALQAENGMLKSFKIMEITDNYTQISPNHTEDESDTKVTTTPRRGQEIADSKSAVISKSPSKEVTHRHSAPSPGPSETYDNFDSTVGRTQTKNNEETSTDETSAAPVTSNTNSAVLHIASIDKGFDEREKENPDRVLILLGSSKSSHTTEKGEPPSVARKQQRKQQRYTTRETTIYAQYNTLGDNIQMNLDDIDSSMEAHTDSSLVSATDLDISISSQISSEDSSVVGSDLRVLQRMQKELAETKCTNVLITNELSIIRKHNSDLQNQVQKLLSRNNHLKTKMCDRTLSAKRMEKEMSGIKDENNRLQQQALILQEEMARVEKEKAKFERNMSSTKSENKRLKSDLSNIKAESYRTMKELVNLQSENRRLQLEIEKLREEARSFKSGLSDESTSQELSLWGTMSQRDFWNASHRSLQEKPATPDPVYLRQRAASDLNFSQYPRLENSPETPELSPLNLSKELHDHSTDGGNYRKMTTFDVISPNSASGSRTSDPLSRRSSPISFASDTSLPNETDKNAHKCEKDDGKEHAQEEEEGRGKNKTKIKTILRKLQHSKKNRTSK